MSVDLKKLRQLGVDELTREAQSLREEIWKLRLQLATGQLQSGAKIRDRRHDLARVLTLRTAQETEGRRKSK